MSMDSMLEVYLLETVQSLERLEELLLAGERNDEFTPEQVDEIFRILHTIKGSSAMMEYDEVSRLAHAMEDLFSFLRDNQGHGGDHRTICDLVISANDFMQSEMEKLESGQAADGEAGELIDSIKQFHQVLEHGEAQPAEEPVASESAPEQSTTAPVQVEAAAPVVADVGGSNFFKAHIFFAPGCQMENTRAFGVMKSVENLVTDMVTIPEDVLADHVEDQIIDNGFVMYMRSDDDGKKLKEKIDGNMFLHSVSLNRLDADDPEIVAAFGTTAAATVPSAQQEDTAEQAIEDLPVQAEVEHAAPSEPVVKKAPTQQAKKPAQTEGVKMQSYMNVNLAKLDKLMELMGEIVISEGGVISHPDIQDVRSDAFNKAASELRKLTDELQDIVMSIRMVPISTTFHKMERIIRDISKKVNKQAELIIIGENTEVDKNVIDSLGDPLMHIIRNSMDHGIEMPEDRIAAGKDPIGKVILEAKNMGSDVVITITDDGRGLDKDKLAQLGIERGLIKKPASEVTEQEAYDLIFNAGFSTKEQVTEFSGRGVGMDVAIQNINKVGGNISVTSKQGEGTVVTIRIPLTLAIIDGLQISVGDTIFILPILNTQESFKPEQSDDIFTDPDGNEMIMIRGNCYPMVRLNDYFNIPNRAESLQDGICIIVEADRQTYCLFCDELLGEQQTVVKPLPHYIARTKGWAKSVSGCTIMGNGTINLILDINSIQI